MKLFGLGKKPGDLKTLSEKEIQVKLYGHLRSPHPGAANDSNVLTLPKSSSSRPAIVHPQSQTLSHDERKNVNLSSSMDPLQAAPRSSYAPKMVKEEPSEPSRQNKKNSQKKSFQQFVPKTAFAGKFFSFVVSRILPAVWSVLKAALTLVAQLIVAVIGAVTQIFLKIDFKSPRVRRAFYGTLGIGLLAFLLVGIHMLNVKREIAMRHPNRVVSAKPKPRLKIPAKVTSQTILSEQASEAEAEAKPLSAVVPASETTDAAEAASVTDAQDETAASDTAAAQRGQVIQIATFAAQSDAEKLVERLKNDGWKCFVKPLVRPGGRTYYCVFLGAYKTYQEAETKLGAFKKKEIAKPFQDAFIRSL